MSREEKILVIGAILYIGTCLFIFHFSFAAIYENICHRTVARNLYYDYVLITKDLEPEK